MAEDLFELYRGDDFILMLNIADESENSVDITGWRFWATMKLSSELPDEEAPVKVDIPPLEGTAPSMGIAEILLPAEQTKALIPTRYAFDIQCERDGMISTVFSGTVKVKGDVTWRVS